MIELGFLHPDQAPTPEAAAAFPNDVPLASSQLSGAREATQWGERGQHVLKPKSKGSGIMISDNELDSYLALTDEEYHEEIQLFHNMRDSYLLMVKTAKDIGRVISSLAS